MKLQFLVPAVMAGMMLFSTSCKKDDTPDAPQASSVKEVKELNASSQTEWTYFSFSEGKQVVVTNPRTSNNWDIAFNRYNVKTNGGTSGIGGVEVVNTGSKDFDAVTQYPGVGYQKDEEVTTYGRPKEGQTTPTVITNSVNKAITGTVMNPDPKGFYNYTPPAQGSNTPHINLTKYVYVIKTTKGNYVKIQITEYTNSKGETGYLTFKYDTLTSQAPVEKVSLTFTKAAAEVQLDATADWQYFSLATGSVVSATQSNTTSWDIAFKGYYVKLNGGVSGKGKGEALKTESKDFETVKETIVVGFEKDKEVTFKAMGGKETKENVSPVLTGGFGSTTGTINISPANMKVWGSVYAPNKWVYIIKTADGKYAKVQVTDFYKEVNGKKVENFPKLKYQLSDTQSK